MQTRPCSNKSLQFNKYELLFLILVTVVCLVGFKTAASFVISSTTSSPFHRRRYESTFRIKGYTYLKQGHDREEELKKCQDEEIRSRIVKGKIDTEDKFDEMNTGGFHQPELSAFDEEEVRPSTEKFTTITTNTSPDRAISIVSELKANAALFAAFAYGSLNLPSTLTVNESKVTGVTTSLSISRPLPDSDLVRSFVVLDVCTLCLMISCVAASQLLIYRLTDGSYEDLYREEMNKQTKINSRDSALGRLVTDYSDEFTVARLTFDFGLVTLLLAVGVRTLAIYDDDISVPVTAVIATTAVFLATAYLTSYIEVFQTAEKFSKVDTTQSNRDKFNTRESVFSTMRRPLLFLTKISTNNDNGSNRIVPRIVLPLALISVGLGIYFALIDGSSGLNLSRLGQSYGATPGESKLRVVTEKIDSEKTKFGAKKKKKLFIMKPTSSNSADTTYIKARGKVASEKNEAENKALLEKATVSEKVSSD